MSPGYEVPHDEISEQAIGKDEGRALDARLREAQPLEMGAADQMHDSPIHTQGDAPDCLLECARMAEHTQLGSDPGLDAFKQPAVHEGIYDPDDGTDMNRFTDVINERPGLEAHLQTGNGPEDIKSNLDAGCSTIVGVDSYEYYKGQYNLAPDGGGHALLMTGADRASNGNWEFTVNDPNFETSNQAVDGRTFLESWDAVGRPMITVQKTGGA